MALANLAGMTTSTIGQGTVTLDAAIDGPYLSFADAGVTNGSTISYSILDGNEAEAGRGTYSSGTLTRSVHTSTNGNDPIDLSGSALVFISPVADDITGWLASSAVSSYMLTVLDDATATQARSTLGLGTAATLDAGTSVGNLVEVQSGGKYPALDGSLITNLAAGDVSAAANFGTDNVLIRSDGTSKGVQSTGISVADTTDAVSGVGSIVPKAGGTAALGSYANPFGGFYLKDGGYFYIGTTSFMYWDATNSNFMLYNGVILAEQFAIVDADRTLTSTTSQQAIFKAANDAINCFPTTTYFFEAQLYLTGMSATSGNLTFSVLGAGTATITSSQWQAWGMDTSASTTAAAFGGSLSTGSTGAGNIVTAGTGTELIVTISGVVRVNGAGTLIPSVGLTTATAATLKANSWFRLRPVGSNTVNAIGDWS